MPPYHILFTYSILAIFVPILVSNTYFGSDILTRVSYYLNLHYRLNKIELIILCVGFITFYTYVLFGIILDVVQATRYDFTRRFENAHLQLRELFPPFIVSCFLIYTNTTRFDTFRDRFIILQTMTLLVQPITFLYFHPDTYNIVRSFYRVVLFWTLLYAVFPRETTQSIDVVQNLFGTNYGNIRQQWIL